MDLSAQYEIESIKAELQGIIDELNSISYGVKKDFSGIGNDVCATSLANSAKHYSEVKSKLSKMDTSAVTDEFKAKQDAELEKSNIQQTSNSNQSSGNSSKTTSNNTSKSNTSKSNTSKSSSNSWLSSLLKGL